MLQPGRKFNTGSGYRYGFNGKERLAEITNDDHDFGARIYDGRIGRWLSVDPLQQKYPSLSPYNFSNNSPIFLVDPDGKRIIFSNETNKSVEGAHEFLNLLNMEVGVKNAFVFKKNTLILEVNKSLSKKQLAKLENHPLFKYYKTKAEDTKNDLNVKALKNYNDGPVDNYETGTIYTDQAASFVGGANTAANNLLHFTEEQWQKQIVNKEDVNNPDPYQRDHDAAKQMELSVLGNTYDDDNILINTQSEHGLQYIPIVNNKKEVLNYLYVRIMVSGNVSPKVLKVLSKEEGEQTTEMLKKAPKVNGVKQWENSKNLPRSKEIKQ